jgi:hypothetical protein
MRRAILRLDDPMAKTFNDVELALRSRNPEFF